MNSFVVPLTLLASIVAITLATLSLVLSLREEKLYLRKKLTLEENRTQKMLNMMLAKDLPILSGLNQVQIPTHSNYSGSEYIPRDDATEFQRINRLASSSGYGEPIYEFNENDPELAQAIAELSGNQNLIDYE